MQIATKIDILINNYSRSRSKTDNEKKSQLKNVNKNISKKNLHTIKEQNSHKLSRNSMKEPMSLKTKSFLKPSIANCTSIYRTNVHSEAYSTFGTNKTNSDKMKRGESVNKVKNSKISNNTCEKKPLKDNKEYPFINNVRQINLADTEKTYKKNYSIKTNLGNLLNLKSKEKGYRVLRCGSVSYNSSFASQRNLMRNCIQLNQNKHLKKRSVDKLSYDKFMKDRRSLGDNRYIYKQRKTPSISLYSQNENCNIAKGLRV